MAKRKTDENELFEFLMQRVDRRTEWGRKAEEVLNGYKERRNTNALSLLKSLVMELQTDSLADVCALDDEYYKRNAEEQCVCGRHISREVFLMNYKPGTLAQEGIIGVASTGRGVKGVRDYIPLGSKCHERLPSILEELGVPRLRKRIAKAAKEKEKRLEGMVLDVSDELKRKLMERGIDAEQLSRVISLEHAHSLIEGDESGIMFDLDPGTNRNSYNWFREGIKAGDIEDEEVREIWHKLNEAAHLVSEDELATIMTYSHSFRPRNASVLLAGVKDDLLFLSDLGLVNIDRDYRLPETKFKGRREYGRKTIRDVLGQEKVTRVEAIGIHNHFPDIVEKRIEMNRELAQKYGIGRSWDYILKEIGHVFEEVKAELADEYKRWGKIIEEHVLTKNEYITVKGFFKRSRIGKESERENYLRNYSIPAFIGVAPKIVEIGRKIRYARKLGDELSRYDILKQEFELREDVEENFEKRTGISGANLAEVIDMLENVRLEHGPFTKFQEEHAHCLREMHENGLIAKRYLKQSGKDKLCTLKRYYGLLVKKGVKRLDEDVIAARDYLIEMSNAGFIKTVGFDVREIEGQRYGDKELVQKITRAKQAVEWLASKFGEFSLEEFKRQKESAERIYGKYILSAEGSSIEIRCLMENYLIACTRDRTVKCFDPREVRKYSNLICVNEETCRKVRMLSNRKLMQKMGYSMGVWLDDAVRNAWASRETIKIIDGLYSRAEGIATEIDRAESRRIKVNPRDFVLDVVYNRINDDEAIKRVAKGVGRREEAKGKSKSYYWSFKEQYDKWDVLRFSEGIAAVLAGEADRYTVSENMRNRFEDDARKGYVRRRDVERFREAICRFEGIVNEEIEKKRKG